MSYEIRPVPVVDMEDSLRLSGVAFMRGKRPNLTAEQFMNPERLRLGLYEEDRLRAQLSIIDYNLFFGDDLRRCGGIAGVACEPADRGRGHAGVLVRRCLEVMRDAGQYLSLLWPFDHRFYRAYGWDWTGYTRIYEVPLDVLPAFTETANVELLPDPDMAALNPVYEAQAKQYNGAMLRTASRWKPLLDEKNGVKPMTYIYRSGDAIEGYVVLTFPDDKDFIQVTSLAVVSPAAMRGFLGLFRRFNMTVKKVRWHAPADDGFWLHLAHWDIKTTIESSGMGRIVDVKQALEAIKPDPGLSCSVVLELADIAAPWNEGIWDIAMEDGKVQVSSGIGAPDVRMDIQSLTQAYWGTPSLDQLNRNGRVEILNADAMDNLMLLLPSRTVWLDDDF